MRFGREMQWSQAARLSFHRPHSSHLPRTYTQARQLQSSRQTYKVCAMEAGHGRAVGHTVLSDEEVRHRGDDPEDERRLGAQQSECAEIRQVRDHPDAAPLPPDAGSAASRSASTCPSATSCSSKDRTSCIAPCCGHGRSCRGCPVGRWPWRARCRPGYDSAATGSGRTAAPWPPRARTPYIARACAAVKGA